MHFASTNLDQLFSSYHTRYRIPPYQRHYVWSENEWRILWNDIEALVKNAETTHFMGVILTRGSEIVDGQQRLTTFQIILSAIRDFWPSAYPYTYLLMDDSTNEKKLTLQTEDDGTFNAIVRGYMHAESDNRLVRALHYFRSAVRSYSWKDGVINNEKLSEINSTIIELCNFAKIDLEMDSKPENIFESLNSKGRELGEWDLLRNNLFLRAGAANLADELFTDYWKPCFGNSIQIWRHEDNLDEKVGSEPFFRYFLRLELGRRYHNVQDASIYAIYRDNLATTSSRGLKDEFRTLADYGRAYCWLFSEDNKKARELLKQLDDSDSNFSDSQVVALLLFIFVYTKKRYQDSDLGTKCASNVVLFTMEMLVEYAGAKLRHGRQRHPLSDNNAQIGNIIDVKKEFVFRDIVNWLGRDWPAEEQTNIAIAFRNAAEVERRSTWGWWKDRAGIGESDNEGDEYTYFCTEEVQQGTATFAVPNSVLLVLRNQKEPNEDEVIHMLSHVKDEKIGVYVPKMRRAEVNSLDDNLSLLKHQEQDPAMMCLTSKYGHRVIGRMGSIDEERIYLRCQGKDVVLPLKVMRKATAIYEGWLIKNNDNAWAVLRDGEKRWIRFGSEHEEKVLIDHEVMGQPISGERVWFWLRWEDQRRWCIVDKAVRMVQKQLAMDRKFTGRLKSWIPGGTYGWLMAEEYGDILIHESAFQGCQAAPEQRLGQWFEFNLIERKGRSYNKNLMEARNVKSWRP